MTSQVNNQSLIPSTDVIQPTLTLKMTTAQSLSTTEQQHSCSGLRSPDDHTQLTYEMTPGFKPFTKWSKVFKTKSITKLDHNYLHTFDAITKLWRNQYNLNFKCTYCGLSWPLGQRKTQGRWVELSLNLVLVWLAFAIGHLRVPKTLTFKMRIGAQPFLWKLVLCMRMKNDFHIKGWAPTLVLKQRHGELGNGLLYKYCSASDLV